MDDGHKTAQMHLASSTIPVALSLAETQNTPTTIFLKSIVAGYNIGIILAQLINPRHRNIGFHTTGTIGTFAAAATASIILNLNQKETINALGIAGTQSSGLLESDHQGTMAKHLHPGASAQKGLLSAILATEGFTGAETIFDGEQGFLSAMLLNKKITPPIIENIEKYLEKNIGKYHIKDTYLKKYPACRHIHSSLDATQHILNEIKTLNIQEKLNSENIESITIKTYKIAAEHNNYQIKNTPSLKQSLPYNIALLIHTGKLTLNTIKQFQENPDNEEIKKLTQLIKIETLKSLDELYPEYRPSIVEIVFKENTIPQDKITNRFQPIVFKDTIESGKDKKIFEFRNNKLYLTKRLDLPYGERESPFSKNEIIEKFNSLNPNMSRAKISIITNTIDNLEQYTIPYLMDIINKEDII